MHWSYYIAYFFGGALLTNAIPHLVSGLTGRSFQTPFAKPPGKGLSSSTVNALWGWFNVIAGYLLVFHVGTFNLHSLADVGALLGGGFLMSLHAARHFGQFHGGTTPLKPSA